MRFIAQTTGIGKTSSGPGFGGKSPKTPDEQVDALIQLYERCRAAVGKRELNLSLQRQGRRASEPRSGRTESYSSFCRPSSARFLSAAFFRGFLRRGLFGGLLRRFLGRGFLGGLLRTFGGLFRGRLLSGLLPEPLSWPAAFFHRAFFAGAFLRGRGGLCGSFRDSGFLGAAAFLAGFLAGGGGASGSSAAAMTASSPPARVRQRSLLPRPRPSRIRPCRHLR